MRVKRIGIQGREARRADQKVAGGAGPRKKGKKQRALAGAKEDWLQNIYCNALAGLSLMRIATGGSQKALTPGYFFLPALRALYNRMRSPLA